MLLFFTFYIISLTFIYLKSCKYYQKINKIADFIILIHPGIKSTTPIKQYGFSYNNKLVLSLKNKLIIN